MSTAAGSVEDEAKSTEDEANKVRITASTANGDLYFMIIDSHAVEASKVLNQSKRTSSFGHNTQGNPDGRSAEKLLSSG